jgi:small subunit ribosomal protein S5
MRRIDPNSLVDLEERVVKTNKCQKTHKGGRTLSWNALVVVGDGRGHVGAAIGKARGIPDAIRKATEAAKKVLIQVPLDGTTIPHQIVTSWGASTVMLKPASPGTGVVAGGSVRAILEAAGVRDVLAKSLGSSNPINTAWATLKALENLRTAEQVAERRGVDLRQMSVVRQMSGRQTSAAAAATPDVIPAAVHSADRAATEPTTGAPASADDVASTPNREESNVDGQS